MSDEMTLSTYANEIRTLYQNGQSAQATTLCRHILHYYPKDIATYGQMAEAALERGDLENALELFRRVLSADPENAIAYVGLAVVFERQKLTEEAVWHLERAFELAPEDPGIRQELQRLYREVGQPVSRVKLTPGALARLYAQQGLYARAIQEYQFLLRSSPNRYDLQTALVEATWRAGRVREAAELAQKLVEKLPFSLKANLILGTALQESGVEEGANYLKSAQAVDPTNHLAREMLGSRSPLDLVEPTVPRYVEGAEYPPLAEPPREEAVVESPALESPATESLAIESLATDYFTSDTDAESALQSVDIDISELAGGEKSALDLAREFFEADQPGDDLSEESAPSEELDIAAGPVVPQEAEQLLESAAPGPDLPSPGPVDNEPEIAAASESEPTPEPLASDLPPWLLATYPTQTENENAALYSAEPTAAPAPHPEWLLKMEETLEGSIAEDIEQSTSGESSTIPEPTAVAQPTASPTIPPPALETAEPTPPVAEHAAELPEQAPTEIVAPSWATLLASNRESAESEPVETPGWLNETPSSVATPTPPSASQTDVEPRSPTAEIAPLPSWLEVRAESAPDQTPSLVQPQPTLETNASETQQVSPDLMTGSQGGDGLTYADEAPPAASNERSLVADSSPRDAAQSQGDATQSQGEDAHVAMSAPTLDFDLDAANRTQIETPGSTIPLNPLDLPLDLPSETAPASTEPVEESAPEQASVPEQAPAEAIPSPQVEAESSGVSSPEKPTTRPEEPVIGSSAATFEQATTTGVPARAAPVSAGPSLGWVGATPAPVVPQEQREPSSAAARRQRTLKAAERLELARFLRDDNRMGEALTEYDYIVQHAPRLVQELIPDLEELIARPDAPVQAHRILGDAYTRVDRLSDALERYRFVLEQPQARVSK